MPGSYIVDLAQVQQFAAINVLSDPGHIAGPIVIPNACRFILNWTLTDGKTGKNVLCAQVPAGFNPTTAIADAFLATLTTGGGWTNLAVLLATTCSLSRVDIQDIRSTAASLVTGTSSSHPGTAAGTAMPDEVAAVITIRANGRGPGFRGRMYIPGWASNAAGTGGVIAPAAVTALTAWAGVVGNAFSGAGVTWGLANPSRAGYTSPKTGRVFPPRNPVVLTPVTASVRDNHWDTMRRRGLR